MCSLLYRYISLGGDRKAEVINGVGLKKGKVKSILGVCKQVASFPQIPLFGEG